MAVASFDRAWAISFESTGKFAPYFGLIGLTFSRSIPMQTGKTPESTRFKFRPTSWVSI
ncbi:hypothetical protein [Spirosoma sp.]|uniref:hypothetical protein n=1 Tax=Spirosoma sp. TaxID=1899569 RepID=UPI002624B9D3|nr:hypothetical protein [Spirosoma sp.]MCX6216399.1 hypothetical protein [Spirosoma sp.]